MARFLVKASEFKNVCKAVNDRQLESLKKEIIEILKKQDEKDVKKAIDYFNSQEEHYTHLEKSINGKWIQKAGYGVGTVRIWKGKKYKKIAPGKWARVFDKEGRGTNIAIGKLIARVQKIDNVEDLMAFVMQNKQRFVDENGIDLPVLDKLRAAVDARNNGGMGSKGTSKPAEKTDEKYDKELIDSWKDDYKDFSTDVLKEKIEEYTKVLERAKNDNPSPDQRVAVKQNEHRLKALNELLEEKKNKPAENKNNNFKKNPDIEIMDSKLSQEEVKDILDKYGCSKEFAEYVVEQNEAENREPIDMGKADELREYSIQKFLSNFNNPKEAIDYAKKYDAKMVENGGAGFDWKIEEYCEEKNIDINKPIESEAEKHQNRSDAMKGNKNAEKEPETKNPYDSMNEKEIDIEVSKELDNLAAKSKMPTIHEAANYIKENNKELYNNLEKRWGDSLISALADVAIDRKNKKDNEAEKTLNIDTSVKALSFDELQPIASNKSVGENEVQLPYSKDLANEIESLKNCTAPKWEPREFLKHVYYENGKLITTDARRMKFIEVGELEGIPNGSYVDINTDKSGINIKKIDVDARFPNYSKVIPEDLKQTATLDTKLIKDKIKEMQKDGAIDKKGTNLVQLEFRDGKVFIDDTPVGEAKDIKMKYSNDWGPAKEDTNYMNINADYLVNALSGKTSVLQIGERADKAIEINTGSSSSILMPMSGSDKKMDYGKGRQAKKDANEKKSALKEAYKKTNEEFVASIKEHYGDRFKRLSDSAAANLTERMADMSDEALKLNYDRLKFNLDKVMDKKEFITEDTKVDNKLKLGLRDAILYQTTAKEHPEVIERFEEELEKRGITVKKSLFDDFIVDMFVEEDEEEEPEEPLYNIGLFNDYSAEQPELFNSTEMMVSEAFNRCNCL